MARVLPTLLVITCIASTAVGFIPSRALKAAVAAGRQTGTSHFVPLARPPLKRHTRAPIVRRADGGDEDNVPNSEDMKRAEERTAQDDGEDAALGLAELDSDDDDGEIDFSLLEELMDDIWTEDASMPSAYRAAVEMAESTEQEVAAKKQKAQELFGHLVGPESELLQQVNERSALLEEIMVDKLGIMTKVVDETTGEYELEPNMDDIPEEERWPKMLEVLTMMEAEFGVTEQAVQDGYDKFVEDGWAKAVGVDDEMKTDAQEMENEDGNIQDQLDELVKLQFAEDKKKKAEQMAKKKKKKPASDDEDDEDDE